MTIEISEIIGQVDNNLSTRPGQPRQHKNTATSSRESAFSGVRWTLICNGINLAGRMLCLMVLSRQLSSSDFGNYSIGMTIVQLLELLLLFGLGPAIIQLTDIRPEHYETAGLLGILLGLVTALVAAASGGLVAEIYSSEVLVYLVPCLSLGL